LVLPQRQKLFSILHHGLNKSNKIVILINQQ
jgi:hypothetical protein